MNYDAINFKNKDVDKFSTKFGNGDPVKKKSGFSTEAERDSVMMSKGFTPLGNNTYERGKTESERSANKQGARQSAPSKGIKPDTSAGMKARNAAEEALKPKPNLPNLNLPKNK